MTSRRIYLSELPVFRFNLALHLWPSTTDTNILKHANDVGPNDVKNLWDGSATDHRRRESAEAKMSEVVVDQIKYLPSMIPVSRNESDQ
jgi:hypothetical protein